MLTSRIKMDQSERGSVEIEEAKKDSNHCRLGTLNFDCLEKIFERLSTKELIQLCALNPIVHDAFKERAVKKREIIFSEWTQIWDTETIFKEFGEWMKFTTIKSDDIDLQACKNTTEFEYFLNLFVKHCSENRLQTLSLHFDIGKINLDLLNAAKPFFTNLRKIHYTSVGAQENSGQDQFFATIIDSAKELESIQLENTWNKGTWLQHINMQNIQNIALINSSIFDKKSWDAYFHRTPTKIKRFAWINTTIPNYILCEQMVRNCPNLEHLIDIQHSVPDAYLRDDVFLLNRFNYVSAAKNLKCTRVTSYMRSGQDLIGLFVAIAQENTIQYLSIDFLKNATRRINYENYRLMINNTYPHFTSLRNLEILNNSSCMFWSTIFVNFMCDLINLHEVSVSGDEEINPVQMTRIALAPPNLKVLKINAACTTNLYAAVYTIGRVKEENKLSNGEHAITIVINQQQYTNLRGRDISKSIKFIIV